MAKSVVKLGLTPEMARFMTEIRLDELEAIAEREVHVLCPRWESKEELWRRLFLGARAEEGSGVRAVDLHGAQLLTAELMSFQSGRG